MTGKSMDNATSVKPKQLHTLRTYVSERSPEVDDGQLDWTIGVRSDVALQLSARLATDGFSDASQVLSDFIAQVDALDMSFDPHSTLTIKVAGSSSTDGGADGRPVVVSVDVVLRPNADSSAK